MIHLSDLLRNAILDGYDSYFPAGTVLQLRSGAPAGANNAAAGLLLVTITLPITPWAASASGVKSKAGVWSAPVTIPGTIGHYRLVNGSNVEEGTVTTTGGGGDMTVNTTNATVWRVVTVVNFNKTLA